MRIGLNLDATVAKTATNFHLRTGAGTKQVVRGWLRQRGALSQFWAALAVTLSSSTAIGRGNSAATVSVTSAPVTANVTGAAGTPAHNWTRTAPDSQVWTIDDPTSGTTTFTTNCDQGVSHTATFIDTVTDPVTGQSLASGTVTVTCANIYYGGGYLGPSPPPPGMSYP